MFAFEDVHFQLVDLPPVSADFMESWLTATLQPADGALLVIDISDPECVDHVPAIMARLGEKKITLRSDWPGLPREAEAADDDPFRIDLPTLLLANKSDLDPGSSEVDILQDLLGLEYPALTISAETGDGLEELGPFLFRALEIVRVYTKSPGKPPDILGPHGPRETGRVLPPVEGGLVPLSEVHALRVRGPGEEKDEQSDERQIAVSHGASLPNDRLS